MAARNIPNLARAFGSNALLKKVAKERRFEPAAPFNQPLSSGTEFKYDLIYVPKVTQNNRLRNRSENKAGIAQTQQEHNAALNTYLNNLNLPVEERRRLGIMQEKKMTKWAPGFDDGPRRALTPSSSVARAIKITPKNNIEIVFPNGETYTYRGGNNPVEASMAAMELLNSESIGRELNPHRNGWGKKHHIQK